MTKLINLFIIGIAFNSMALSGFTYKWTPAAGDTVTKDKLKSNYDSIRIWSGRAADTMNKKPNFAQVYNNHDSTYKYAHIDTIVGGESLYVKKAKVQKAYIDTIVGGESLYVKKAKVQKAYIDTMRNRVVHNENGVDIYEIGNDTPSINTDVRLNFSSSRPSGFIRVHSGIISGFSLSQDDNNSYMAFQSRTGENSRQTWLTYLSGATHFKGDVFDTGMVAATNFLGNYIQFGTTANSKCSTYIDTTFPDSIFDGATFRLAINSARIVQIGSSISLYQPSLAGTITAATGTYIKGIPEKFMPPVFPVIIPIIILNNSVIEMGRFNIAAGGISIETLGGSELTAGTGGIESTTVIKWMK